MLDIKYGTITAKTLRQHTKAFIAMNKSWADRVADVLTAWFGTATFLVLNIALFSFWIAWNSGYWNVSQIDPFPFNFLTMAVSLEAIFLSIIVLISQNRQGRIADLRQQIDFELNVRTEEEITKVLQLLDELRHHAGIKHRDPELTEMKQRIDINALAEKVQSGESRFKME